MPSVYTEDNAVLFVVLNVIIVGGVKTIGRHKLRRTAGALAKLCALHALPAFLSSVPPGGAYLKAVLEPLGDVDVRPRTVTTAFGDDGLVAALAATGRKTLVLAGVASEIVVLRTGETEPTYGDVLRTALDAREAGYAVQIAIDACGGFSDRTEAAAWSRATTSGAVMTSVVTLASELTGDFTTETGAKTLALLYEAVGK